MRSPHNDMTLEKCIESKGRSWKMKEETKESINTGKRKFIKKAAVTSAFVAPTVVSFRIKDLYACASGGFEDGCDVSWGG